MTRTIFFRMTLKDETLSVVLSKWIEPRSGRSPWGVPPQTQHQFFLLDKKYQQVAQPGNSTWDGYERGKKIVLR